MHCNGWCTPSSGFYTQLAAPGVHVHTTPPNIHILAPSHHRHFDVDVEHSLLCSELSHRHFFDVVLV